MTRDERLDEIAKVAVMVQVETGVPARLIIAQWAIESKWGEKKIGDFNFFGIKKSSRHTKSATVTTTEERNGKRVKEVHEFADYDSLEDAVRDHAYIISQVKYYRAAWDRFLESRNIAVLAARIATKYATASDYQDLLLQIAGQDNVAKRVRNVEACWL